METPQVLLEHHLKALRLPTFLREYDKVAQQCAAEGVYPRLAAEQELDRERRATELQQARFRVVGQFRLSGDSVWFWSWPAVSSSTARRTFPQATYWRPVRRATGCGSPWRPRTRNGCCASRFQLRTADHPGVCSAVENVLFEIFSLRYERGATLVSNCPSTNGPRARPHRLLDRLSTSWR